MISLLFFVLNLVPVCTIVVLKSAISTAVFHVPSDVNIQREFALNVFPPCRLSEPFIFCMMYCRQQ